MTKYFLGTTPSSQAEQRYRLFAEVDERHYWMIEWTCDQTHQTSTVHEWKCGLRKDTLRSDDLTEITLAELRKQFGSFANYLERSIGGFRSYIAWMTPDSVYNEVIWK